MNDTNLTPSSSGWAAGARKRAFVAAGIFLVVGGALALAPRPEYVVHDEKWVADKLPTAVGDFRMTASTEPGLEYCSYKMDKTTYDVLKPWGIVPRVFASGNQAYDVVVIGSNTKDSFHSPNVCFSAQGWVLSNERIETLKTKSRGDVPVTLVDMDKEGTKTFAMYFYRLRSGYVGSNTQAKKDMFFYKLTPGTMGQDNEGGFIRIIPTGTDTKVEDLKKFAADWVDAASVSSGNYY